MGYTIYGYRLSYFTRKIEAAFEWHALDFTYKSKTIWRKSRVEKKGGTHQVPVVVNATGDWLADTTPIIEMVDQTRPERRLFPTGTEGILVRLVEEWLDEWFPRVVIHYRWNVPENAAFAGATLAGEMFPILPRFVQRKLGAKVANWGKRAVRALAINDPHQQSAVEAELARLLAAAEKQLQQTPYLLGSRPTAADAAIMGALRAHVGFDPTTARILANFPTLSQWMNDAPPWDGSGDIAPIEAPTDFARFVLGEAKGAYQTFLVANADALATGQKAFVIDLHGKEVSMLARRYPEKSRQVLRTTIAESLTADQASTVAALLDEYGLASAFG